MLWKESEFWKKIYNSERTVVIYGVQLTLHALVAYDSYPDAFKNKSVCCSFDLFFLLMLGGVPELHLESLSVRNSLGK